MKKKRISTETRAPDIEARVQHAAEAALDKKAFDLEVLEVGALTSIGDYFMICSTRSEKQSHTIVEAIEARVREVDGVRPLLVEGKVPGRWILIDYGDFVVHVFTEDCRKYYGLERLWGDAPNVTGQFVHEGDAEPGRPDE